jgi:hypothetical protein
VSDLRQQAWWTPADCAELDAFTWALVDAVYAHREAGCELCTVGYPPCPVVGDAIERVIQWRQGRMLLSLAAWLRARQDERDEAVAARSRR